MLNPWHELSIDAPDHGEIVEVAWGEGGRRRPRSGTMSELWIPVCATCGRDGERQDLGHGRSRWWCLTCKREVYGTLSREAGGKPLNELGPDDTMRIVAAYGASVGPACLEVGWFGGARLPDSFTSWARRADA